MLSRLPRPSALLASLAAIVAVWWFTFGDDSADDHPWDGLKLLFDGIVDLPRLIFDGGSYQSWWEYVSDQEGLGEVWANVVDHVQLVAMSMLFAIIIGVVLGIVVHRIAPLRGLVLGVFSVMLTVPSLALFAVFIPISFIGTGDRGPIIALTLYSVLPILRNTITGLEEVDRAVVEAAKGMGMGAWQRLARVELPLAWPVMLTGIRVATLLNIGIAAIAVLVGGTGLGVYVNDGLTRFPLPTSVERMWTGVVFTIVLALVVDLAFTALRRFTTPRGLRR